MKDIKFYLKFMSLGLFVCFIVFGSIYCLSYITETKIKKEQVWVYVSKDKNPYRRTEVEYKKVIEVKSGYVLYLSNWKDTVDSKINVFKYNSKLIKK